MPRFNELGAELQHLGYEAPHAGGQPKSMFLKRFRPTGRLIAQAHRELDTCLWRDLQPHLREPSRGGIPGAMDHFLLAPAWVPSTCGWSRRVRLRNGVQVLLAILLMPREQRQRHRRPEACVQLEPPKGISREQLRGLIELVKAAGWQAVDVQPTGKAPVEIIPFWKDHLGPAGPAGERARLDALARRMLRMA